jgi:hypothetical protein
LKNGKQVYIIKNQTNINARVIFYDIITKVTSINGSTNLDDPIEAWTKGLTDFGVTNGHTLVASTPFKSPEFRKLYKVLKTTYVSLEPGQQHEHITVQNYNRVIDSLSFENTAVQAIPSITRFTIMVFYGHLAHESATAAKVTTAPITLDWMIQQTYSYSFLQPSKASYTVTNNLPTDVLDFDHMGESGDVDSNVVPA